jgi:hypothetical protein
VVALLEDAKPTIRYNKMAGLTSGIGERETKQQPPKNVVVVVDAFLTTVA